MKTFGDGVGERLSGHWLGCVLVLPGAGRVILQEGELWPSRTGGRKPAQPDLSLLSVVAADCCRLVLPGLECAFSLGVVLELACFVALETEECGMLSPRPEIVSCTLWPECCTPPLVSGQAVWCWRDGVWGGDLLSQVLVWLLPMNTSCPASPPPSARWCRISGEQLLLIYISHGILMVMSFCLSIAPVSCLSWLSGLGSWIARGDLLPLLLPLLSCFCCLLLCVLVLGNRFSASIAVHEGNVIWVDEGSPSVGVPSRARRESGEFAKPEHASRLWIVYLKLLSCCENLSRVQSVQHCLLLCCCVLQNFICERCC